MMRYAPSIVAAGPMKTQQLPLQQLAGGRRARATHHQPRVRALEQRRQLPNIQGAHIVPATPLACSYELMKMQFYSRPHKHNDLGLGNGYNGCC